MSVIIDNEKCKGCGICVSLCPVQAISIIKDKAFIGSDTVLIAPVKIGKFAVTGAGSVVTKNKDVPDGKVVAGVPAKIFPVKHSLCKTGSRWKKLRDAAGKE